MSKEKPTKDTKKRSKTTRKKNSKEHHFDLDKIRSYAARGMEKTQIAAALGVSYSSYMKHQQDDPAIYNAFDEGRAQGIALVAAKLMKNVDSMNQRAIEFYLSRKADWVGTSEINHKNNGGSFAPITQADRELMKSNGWEVGTQEDQ